MSSSPVRSEDQLDTRQLKLLNDAHRRLRAAVADYGPFNGQELKPGKPVTVHNVEDVARAQAAVESAERELWRLREELLGWVRPSWAPSATLVADWFSDDDAIYDEIDAGTVR
jgi:hypothetical protein